MKSTTVNQEILITIYSANLASLLETLTLILPIYICLKDLVSSVAWSPILAVSNIVQSPKGQIKSMPIFPGTQ